MNKGVKRSNTEYKGLIDLSDKQSFTHREKLEAKPKNSKSIAISPLHFL